MHTWQGWEVVRAEHLQALWKEKYTEWSKRPKSKWRNSSVCSISLWYESFFHTTTKTLFLIWSLFRINFPKHEKNDLQKVCNIRTKPRWTVFCIPIYLTTYHILHILIMAPNLRHIFLAEIKYFLPTNSYDVKVEKRLR